MECIYPTALVTSTIPRYLVIQNPMGTLQSNLVRRRARYSADHFQNNNYSWSRILVALSWGVSLLLSSPQALMFRVVKHPYRDFYQCTSDLVFEMNSDLVMAGDKPTFLFFGIDPKILYKIYNFYFLFFVYFFPLFCILVSYASIFILIRRWVGYKMLFLTFSHRREFTCLQSIEETPQIQTFFKSQWKNLRMSVLQVLFFAVFWAPYVIHQSWYEWKMEMLKLRMCICFPFQGHFT